MDAFAHAQLTDALARGRLAPAEVAAIPPRELEALFESAARCLDTGRDTEAAHLLGGLVTLFPFSARYWRARAIALHRRLRVEAACAAYEASLALEPGHELTRCYHSEILLYMGRADEARTELRELLGASNREVAERAAELLRQLDTLLAWRPPTRHSEPGPTLPGADLPRFTLDDEHDLPLEPSRFDEVVEPTVVREEVTRTARIFAPISDQPTAPIALPEVTDTAIMRRHGQTEPGHPPDKNVTATALLPGRGGRPPAPQATEGSVTALLPGRKGGPVAMPMGPVPDGSEEPTKTEVPSPDTQDAHGDREPTLTAVTLRRGGLLSFDSEGF